MEERRAGPGVLAFGAALVLVFWAIARPALWLDEAASAVATDRSWTDLWRLWGGTDAPLMPYYLLLKALRELSLAVLPRAADHPEVLLRWPSAVAAAAAVGVLVSWLRRMLPTLGALTCGALLMLFEGFSRYGQEARPYALIMLLAVASTAVWWRLIRTASVGATFGYGLCVAAMAGLHALSALLVLAHLAAALLIRDGPDDTGDTGPPLSLLMFAAAAIGGLLLASPAIFAAVSFGGGATRYHALTGESVFSTFTALFGGVPQFLVVAALAAVGGSRWNSARDANLTRIAVCWALVPWPAYLPAVVARPNLLLGRYLLFTVPGWAILAGLGLVTLGTKSPKAREFRTIVLTGALGLLFVLQWPALLATREPAAHGRDLRPLAALLRQPAYRDLPLAVTTSTDLLQLAAYTPAAAPRVRNQAMSAVNIWPDRLDRITAVRNTVGSTWMVLIVRAGTCGPMSVFLNSYGFVSASTAGQLTAVVLKRNAGLLPPRGFRHPTPAVRSRLVLPCPGRSKTG